MHNICIDAGDVNAEEDAAVRNEEVRLADRNEINLAQERVLGNFGESLAELFDSIIAIVSSIHFCNSRCPNGAKCSCFGRTVQDKS